MVMHAGWSLGFLSAAFVLMHRGIEPEILPAGQAAQSNVSGKVAS
jgi:hypothetical protein